jgi:hypothetical protein
MPEPDVIQCVECGRVFFCDDEVEYILTLVTKPDGSQIGVEEPYCKGGHMRT